MTQKQTVVITGGAGFLGSHLCDAFLREDYRVVAIDNFITGSERNIAHLGDNHHFELLNQNVSDGIEFSDPVDIVLHFASPASPVDYLMHPIATLKVGALGTHNALGLAKEKKSKFMIASTSEIYGDPLTHPQKEDYWGNVNTVGPRGVYDEAKRYAEAMTMAYHRTHGLDTKIIRIFNTYGPRMRLRDGRAIPEFICAALQNKSIPVFGDGNQTRSFCYVDDLVRGIVKVILSDINDPINLGNPNEMTIYQLAETIIRIMKSDSTIEHLPLPQDDPKVRQPDITKAKRELGWEPEINLETGLVNTIEYFKANADELNKANKV